MLTDEIRVEYGAHAITLALAGLTVEEIRLAMQHVLNVGPDVEAYFDGERVRLEQEVCAGARLVFVRSRGRKGSNEARTVYYGSNGGATRSYCSRLENLGPLGQIAAQLFRTQKASRRAKVYRGGIRHSDGSRQSYRDLAYHRKNQCIERLCQFLEANSCGIRWGWGNDEGQPFAPHVLYIELPQGQVSFDSTDRFGGPDFDGQWDGQRASEQRILEFCGWVFCKGESR